MNKSRVSQPKSPLNARRKLYLAIAAQLMLSSQVYAGPTGGQVVGGDGTIEKAGRNTTIRQNTDRLAIDWESFNIAADERVEFVQPHETSVALNRILGNEGSRILGQLDANGRVILMNPNGVFFGEGATVNVGGLVASGLAIDADDFMNGDFVLSALEGTDGTVVNRGLINASVGGSVALIGQQVKNEGLISATLGSVTLAAGKEAVVSFGNDGMLGVRVTQEILQSELGEDAAVINSGDLLAEGGQILLTASTSRDIFSQAVNSGDMHGKTSVTMHDDGSFTLGGGADVVNTGTVDVSSISEDAGQVVMLGENITHSGTIHADSHSTGRAGAVEVHALDTTLVTESSTITARAYTDGQGGDIKILGDRVGVFDQSTLDASGVNGGGNIHVGGGYQGANEQIPNASRAVISREAQIRADALDHGDGGEVIVWSDNATAFHGGVSVRGGDLGGDGGFVEISSKGHLSFTGTADRSAPMGENGTLLLDPREIFIVDLEANGSTEDDELLSDNQILLGDGNEGSFRITDAAIANALASGDVHLQASEYIGTIRPAGNGFVSIIVGDESSTSSLILESGLDIRLRGLELDLGAGDLITVAGAGGRVLEPNVAIQDSYIATSGDIYLLGYSGASLSGVHLGRNLSGEQIREVNNINIFSNHFVTLELASDIEIFGDINIGSQIALAPQQISLPSGLIYQVPEIELEAIYPPLIRINGVDPETTLTLHGNLNVELAGFGPQSIYDSSIRVHDLAINLQDTASVNLVSEWDIEFAADIISDSTTGSLVRMEANAIDFGVYQNVVRPANIVTNSGSVEITSAGSLDLNGLNLETLGRVDLASDADIIIPDIAAGTSFSAESQGGSIFGEGVLRMGGSPGVSSAPINLTASESIVIPQILVEENFGAFVFVNAGREVALANDLTTNGGNVLIRSQSLNAEGIAINTSGAGGSGDLELLIQDGFEFPAITTGENSYVELRSESGSISGESEIVLGELSLISAEQDITLPKISAEGDLTVESREGSIIYGQPGFSPELQISGEARFNAASDIIFGNGTRLTSGEDLHLTAGGNVLISGNHTVGRSVFVYAGALDCGVGCSPSNGDININIGTSLVAEENLSFFAGNSIQISGSDTVGAGSPSILTASGNISLRSAGNTTFFGSNLISSLGDIEIVAGDASIGDLVDTELAVSPGSIFNFTGDSAVATNIRTRYSGASPRELRITAAESIDLSGVELVSASDLGNQHVWRIAAGENIVVGTNPISQGTNAILNLASGRDITFSQELDYNGSGELAGIVADAVENIYILGRFFDSDVVSNPDNPDRLSVEFSAGNTIEIGGDINTGGSGVRLNGNSVAFSPEVTIDTREALGTLVGRGDVDIKANEDIHLPDMFLRGLGRGSIFVESIAGSITTYQLGLNQEIIGSSSILADRVVTLQAADDIIVAENTVFDVNYPLATVFTASAGRNFILDGALTVADQATMDVEGSIFIDGDLSVGGSAILDAAQGISASELSSLSILGNATFTAGQDIEFLSSSNQFSVIEISNAQTVEITNSTDLELGGLNAQNLTLTTAGDITQTAPLSIQGNANLSALGGGILLTNANNQIGQLSLEAQRAEVHTASDLQLGTITLTGEETSRFVVDGSISQTPELTLGFNGGSTDEVVITAPALEFETTGDLILNSNGNHFSQIAISARDVQLHSASAFEFSDTDVTNLAVRTSANFSQLANTNVHVSESFHAEMVGSSSAFYLDNEGNSFGRISVNSASDSLGFNFALRFEGDTTLGDVIIENPLAAAAQITSHGEGGSIIQEEASSIRAQTITIQADHLDLGAGGGSGIYGAPSGVINLNARRSLVLDGVIEGSGEGASATRLSVISGNLNSTVDILSNTQFVGNFAETSRFSLNGLDQTVNIFADVPVPLVAGQSPNEASAVAFNLMAPNLNVHRLDGSASQISAINAFGSDNQWIIDQEAGSRLLSGEGEIGFTGIQTLNGGSGNDDFFVENLSAPISLNGGAGTNTLWGHNSDNTINNQWSIDGEFQGTLNESVAFENIQNLEGNDGVDTVVFQANAVIGDINTGGGDDIIFMASGVQAGRLDGGAEDNSILDLGDLDIVVNIEGTVLGGGADATYIPVNLTPVSTGETTLRGIEGLEANWTIGREDGDILVSFTDTTGSDVEISHSNVTRIEGAEGINRYSWLGEAEFAGQIIGGTSLTAVNGQNNTWTIDGTDSGNVTADDGRSLVFEGIANLIGGGNNDLFELVTGGTITGRLSGGAGDNTLAIINPEQINQWQLGAANSVTGVAEFGGIQTLEGNVNNDVFAVVGATDVIEIRGGAGDNSLNWLAGDAVINLADNTANETLTFANIGTFAADATNNNTLIGGNTDNLWVLTDDASGNGEVNGLTFSGFNSLQGGEGTDTLRGTDADTRWDINGSREGTVSGIQFSAMDLLIGGAGNDSFYLETAEPSVSINGGGGDNSLSASFGSWVLTERGGGSMAFGTDNMTLLTFQGFNTLNAGIGGSSLILATTDVDGMSVNLGGQNGTGALFNATESGADWQLDTLLSGSVRYGENELVFTGVSRITGSENPEAIDRLFGHDEPRGEGPLRYRFNSGAYDGSLLDAWPDRSPFPEELFFTGINEVHGGNGGNTFILQTDPMAATEAYRGTIYTGDGDDTVIIERDMAGLIFGQGGNDLFQIAEGVVFEQANAIDGGAGVNRIVGVGSFDWQVTGSFTGNIEGVTGFANIQVLEASGTADDINRFEVLEDAEIGDLIGGLGQSLIQVGSGAVVANIDGSAGTARVTLDDSVTITNSLIGGGEDSVLDISAFSNAVEYNFALDEVNLELEYEGFAQVIMPESSAFFGGDGVDLRWNFADFTVELLDENGEVLRVGLFENHSHLRSGTGQNAFILAADSNFNGTIQADAQGDNSLWGSNLNNTWTIDGVNQGSISGGDVETLFSNIATLIGGTGDDLFDIVTGGSISGSLAGGGGANTLRISDNTVTNSWALGAQNSVTSVTGFSGIQTLIGNANDDLFSVTAITDVDSIDGGLGDNSLNWSAGDAVINLADNTANESLAFANISNFAAEGENNSLIGADIDNLWSLTAVGSGTVNEADFSGFNNLQGGAGNDTLVGLDADAQWQIGHEGDLDLNTLTYDGQSIVFEGIEHLVGGTGDDFFGFTERLAQVLNVNGVQTVDGGGGQNQLFANVMSDWEIGALGGVVAGRNDESPELVFESMQSITNNGGNFKVNTLETIVKSYQSNMDRGIIDFSSVEGDIIFDVLGSEFQLEGISSVIGNGENSIVTALGADGIWQVGGYNGEDNEPKPNGWTDFWAHYYLGENYEEGLNNDNRPDFYIANFGGIVGGDGNDEFFIDTSSSFISPIIRGGGGTNTIYGNINNTVDNTWTIDGTYTGTLNSGIAFTNIQHLEGNDGVDTVTFAPDSVIGSIRTLGGDDIIHMASGVQAGLLDGGTGDSVLNLGDLNSVIDIFGNSLEGGDADYTDVNLRLVSDGDGQFTVRGVEGIRAEWWLDGEDAVSIRYTDAEGQEQEERYTNVSRLEGAEGENHFVWSEGGVLTGIIIGGTSLTANTHPTGGNEQPTTWTIDGTDSGSIIAPDGQTLVFEGIAQLIGGAQNDVFELVTGGAITGSLSGGAGNNTLAIANPDQSNQWQLGTANSVTGIAEFSDIQILQGNANNDVFEVVGATDVTEIQGGAGENSLVWSAGDLSINLAEGSANSTLTFSDIHQVSADAANNNTLIGWNLDSDWTLSSASEVTLASAEQSLSATNFQTLQGGTGAQKLQGLEAQGDWRLSGLDQGTVSYAGQALTFAGMTDLSGGSANDSFTLASADAALTGTLSGGAGNNSLVAFADAAYQWTVNGAFSGTASNAGGAALTFLDMQTIQGSDQGDRFDVTADGAITTLRGGDGDDAFALSAGSSVDALLGGAGENSLQAGDGNNAWLLNSADSQLNDTVFNDITVLLGGAGNDQFTLLDGALALSLDGGAGDNQLMGADQANAWTLAESSSVNDVSFANIASVFGAANNVDTFTVTGDLTFNIDGVSDDNTLIADTALDNDWTIDGIYTGTLNSGIAFFNVQHLEGNDGVDTVTFAPDSVIGSIRTLGGDDIIHMASGVQAGLLDGGTGDSRLNLGNLNAVIDILGNTLEGGDAVYEAVNLRTISEGEGQFTVRGVEGISAEWWLDGEDAVSIRYTDAEGQEQEERYTNVSRFEGAEGDNHFVWSEGGVLTGSIVGGASLTANTEQDQTWTIDGENAGSISAGGQTLVFQGIAQLIGGARNDVFDLVTGGAITGSLHGGGGANTLAISNPEQINTWQLGADNSVTGIAQFANIQTLEGNTNADSFVIAGTTDVQFLRGNGGANSIVWSDSALSVSLADNRLNDSIEFADITQIQADGGFANSLTGSDADTDWTLTGIHTGTLSQGESVLAFSDFQTLLGGTGQNRLLGDNTAGDWALSGLNSGTLTYGADSLSFEGMTDLQGGTADDIFRLISADAALTGGIVGGGGDNRLIGFADVSNQWTVEGNFGGTLQDRLAFTDIQHLQGGDQGDRFEMVAGAEILTLRGGDGNDQFVIGAGATLAELFAGAGDDQIDVGANVTAQNLFGEAGDNTFVIGTGLNLSGIIDGGVGLNNVLDLRAYALGLGDTTNFDIEELVGFSFANFAIVYEPTNEGIYFAGDGTNIWYITGENEGRVEILEGPNAGSYQFSGIHTLRGGAGSDTFIFESDAAAVSTIIDGGDGDGLNVLDFSAQGLINSWLIDGINSGSVTNSANEQGNIFTNIAYVIGGSNQDTFRVIGDGMIAGIDGGAGNNRLVVDRAEANLWQLGAAAGHSVTGVASFENMQALTGGAGADTFNLWAPNSGITALDGAGGVNQVVVHYAEGALLDLQNNRLDETTVQSIERFVAMTDGHTIQGSDAANLWRLDGLNSGSVQYLAATGEQTLSIEFEGFENLLGGAGEDSFELSDAAQITGHLHGGDGDNSLRGADSDNVWQISGLNQGELEGVGRFENIAHLYGGAAADTFVLAAEGNISGAIHGNSGGSDRLVHQGDGQVWQLHLVEQNGLTLAGGSVAETTFVGIGQIAAGGADQRLTGGDQDNTWQFGDSPENTYVELNNNPGLRVRFEGMAEYQGGSGDDLFRVLSAAALPGLIDGGAGSNRLDLQGVADDLAIGLGAEAALPEGGLAVRLANIGQLTGHSDYRHVLYGNSDRSYTWTLDGVQTGRLSATLNDENNQLLAFENISAIVGGEHDDIFQVLSNVNRIAIDGGGAQTANMVDYSQVNANLQVNLAQGLSAGEGTVSNVGIIRGNNRGASSLHNAELVATDADNQWTIAPFEDAYGFADGVNDGQLYDGNQTITFIDFNRLTGGAGSDVFNLNGGIITGQIDGGAGDDVFNINIAGVNPGLHIVGGLGNDQLNFSGGGEDYLVRYAPAAEGGEFRFSSADANYLVSYQAVEQVQQNAQVETLQIDAGSAQETIAIGNGLFQIDQGAAIQHRNQRNLVVNAGANDTVELIDHINLPGTFAVRNGSLITRDPAASSVTAEQLLLENSRQVGSADARIRTNVQDLSLRNVVGDVYLQEQAGLNIAEYVSSGQFNLLLLNGDLTSSTAISAADNVWVDAQRGNIELTGENQLSRDVTLLAAGAVTVHNNTHLNLAGVTAQSLTARSQRDIRGNAPLRVTGDTVMHASGDILLNDPMNDLNRLQVTDARDVSVVDQNAIELLGINARGAVSVDAVGINVQETIRANAIALNANQGTAELYGNLNTLGGGNISVDAQHILQQGDILSGGSTRLTSATALAQNGNIQAGANVSATAQDGQIVMAPGTATAGADVNYNASGNLHIENITGSAVNLSGGERVVTNGDVIATSGDIQVDSGLYVMSADTLLQAQQGAIRINAIDTASIAGHVSAATGVQIATENGNVNQTGNISVGRGNVEVSAGGMGDLVMSSEARIAVGTGNITIEAGNDVVIGSVITSDTATVRAREGQVVDGNGSGTNVKADNLVVESRTGVGSGDALETEVNRVSAGTDSGNVAISNRGDLTVDKVTTDSGNIRVDSTGDIGLGTGSVSAGDRDGSGQGGNVAIISTEGGVKQTGPTDKPAISATNTVDINARRGSVGEGGMNIDAQRVRVLAAARAGDLTFSSRVLESNLYFHGGFKFEDHIVSVAPLEDVNPAVFSNVRGYFYNDISVRLPQDQRYDEEDI